MAKVFISYDREDSDFAELVQARLEKAGHDTLMDTEFLNVGDNWRDELDQAIRGSHVLLVIMTPEAVVSDYVSYEWAFALGAHGKIIPLELKKVIPFHPRLDVLQRLDFTDKARPWETLFAEVAKTAEVKPVTTIPIPESAPPVIQQAIKALDSLNENEQEAGIKSLAKTDHPAAREALVMALQHPVESVRITAAFEIPDEKDVRRLPGLIDGFRKNREDGLYFSRKISVMGLPATPYLLEALQDQSIIVRWVVAHVLGNIGDVSMVPSLIDALQDKDETVRRYVAEALGKIGDVTAILALQEALKDVDKFVRHRVVEALGKIGDATAIPALHEALKDESDDIRVAAIKTLGELNDDTIADKLLRYLQDDIEAHQILAVSAVVLGRLGVIAASPKLRQWLKDKDESKDVRTSAAEALGLLGDKSVINDLREVFSELDDRFDELRYRVSVTLIRLQGVQIFPLLIEALRASEGGGYSREVIEAIGTVGESAIPALRDILNFPKDCCLSEAAAQALKTIGTTESLVVVKQWERSNS